MTLRNTLLVAGAALLIATAPAFAQKIAPTRNYNAYDETRHERPDKDFGLPTFGARSAELPQQKTIAPQRPQPSGPATASRETPDSGLGLPDSDSGNKSLPNPSGAPGASIDEANQSNLDFFPKSKSWSSLPPDGSAASGAGAGRQAGSEGMDTPLFDTPDGAPTDNGLKGTED